MLVYSYIVQNEPLLPETFAKLLSTIPEIYRLKILRYRRWEDRNNGLFGKLLLKSILIKFFGEDKNCLDRLYSNNNGKLFLNKNIDFNISHSGKLVLCAVSDESIIGVDVEIMMDDFCVNDIRPFLRTEEYDRLNTKPNRELFYDFWTKKESVLKAKGFGLSFPLKEVRVFKNKACVLKPDLETWYFNELTTPNNYKGVLCTEKDNLQIQFESADQLLWDTD